MLRVISGFWYRLPDPSIMNALVLLPRGPSILGWLLPRPVIPLGVTKQWLSESVIFYQFIKMPAFQFDCKPPAVSLFPKITKTAANFVTRWRHRPGEVSWRADLRRAEGCGLARRFLQRISKWSLCHSILDGGDEKKKSCPGHESVL